MLGLRSLLPAVALFSTVTSCAAPPAPAAEHAPPPTAAAPRDVPAAQRCGLVRRAQRTWVGFAEGMTLEDMVPAGQAAGEVVRALDATLCAYSRGEQPAALRNQRAGLQNSTARGAKLEVTKVLWQDTELTRAQVEVHAQAPADGSWLASVVWIEQRGWQIERFDRQ
ncbi:MAG TPA: hypothetical protein VJR89_06620 [Polyangiales bacterium]|nr:hypothetical protein [Polyangiales bacterium]